MKHTIWVYTVGMCLGLSACATQYVTHEMGAKQGHVAADYQYQVILEDQLVAIGTPKTQIANHADAWVLIGKQYSYLMTVSGKPTGYLQQVLHSVDARFLRIHGQYSRDGLGAVLIAERPEQDKLFEQVRLDYRKPLAQVSAAERQRLQDLGFYCNAINSSAVYDCSLGLNVQYHLITAAKPTGSKVHKFAQPHLFKITLRSDGNSAAPAATWPQKALLPLALVVDVVTAPVQWLGGAVVQGIGAQQ